MSAASGAVRSAEPSPPPSPANGREGVAGNVRAHNAPSPSGRGPG